MEDTKEGSNQIATPVATPPPTVFMGFTLSQALLVLSWPALLLSGLYAGVLVKQQDIEVLETAIRARPAIRVVNVTEVMRSHVASGLTADQAITAANETFQQWGKAGYLVIDNNAVLALPEGMEVDR